MSFFSMKDAIFKSLFKKPATIPLSDLATKKTPRTRGHIEIEIEKCIFCGICQKRCPTGAITVTKADVKWSIERFQCIQCNCCVEVCPKKCLLMDGLQTPSSVDKTSDTVIQPKKPETPVAEKANA